MATRFRTWRNQHVLPLLAEYFDTTPDGLLDAESVMRRRVIEEILLPARVVPAGTKRRPVRLSMRRRAQLESSQGARTATLRTLGLDGASIDLSPEKPLTAFRDPVVVSIEGSVPGLWWRFLGHVAHSRHRGRHLSIHLERTLGCLSVSPEEMHTA
jgi:hypothetical protein